MAEAIVQSGVEIYKSNLNRIRERLTIQIKEELEFNPDIKSAADLLEDSKSFDHPEMATLQAAAILYGCPTPSPHIYINGETKITFDDEPRLHALTNVLSQFRPIAHNPNSDPLFKQYFENMEIKLSELTLEKRILKDKHSPFHDSKKLSATLIKEVKKAIKQSKKFPNDVNEKIKDIYKKISDKEYVLGVNEIEEFYELASQAHQFQPDKKLTKVYQIIASDKKNEVKVNKSKINLIQYPIRLYLALNQALVGGNAISPIVYEGWVKNIDRALSLPDGDPIRALEASGEIASFAKYMIDNRDVDPIDSATDYLQEKENVDGTVAYLLTDYFESLEHFPAKDRQRLIDKSINFITTGARLYNSENDPTGSELKKYLTETADDKEMQDLLGYTVLPFLAYLVKNEDSYANEQWLENVNDHFQKGEYKEIVPYLQKAFKLLINYKPDDNILTDFSNPHFVNIDGETITIPQEITDKLNALPPNPNYLSPKEFVEESEKSYVDLWHKIYGENSTPPELHWSPVMEQPEYVDKQLQMNVFNPLGLNTISPYRKITKDEYRRMMIVRDHITEPTDTQTVSYFQSDQNKDSFTLSTIGTPSSFKDVYDLFKEKNDPYSKKFTDRETFFEYYKDYINFIKENGTPENPIPESLLEGYIYVKCNGNMSEASIEKALLDKLMSRYDISDGSDAHNSSRINGTYETTAESDQAFYRSIFLEENLPLLMSINYQTLKGQNINEISKILLTLDPRLIDQVKDVYSGRWDGLTLGSKKFDLAEMWGTKYHRDSEAALVANGIGNPSAVAIMHTVNEIPFEIRGETGLTIVPNENGAYKPIELAKAGVDDIELRHFLEEEVPNLYIRPKETPTIQAFDILDNNVDVGKITEIDEDTSSVVLFDKGTQKKILYLGDTGLIKTLSENGFAPATISIEINEYQMPEPKILMRLLEYPLKLPYRYLEIENYNDSDQKEITSILWEKYKGKDIAGTPQNIKYFIKFGYPLSKEDLNAEAIISSPFLNDQIKVLAAPYLDLDPTDPFIKTMVSFNNNELNFEYYTRLSEQEKITAESLYPDIKSNAYNFATSYEFNQSYGNDLNKDTAERTFRLIIENLKTNSEDTSDAIWRINRLLPYLSSESVIKLINSPKIKNEDLPIIFSSSAFTTWENSKEIVQPEIENTLINLEPIIETRNDLKLYLAPAYIISGVWDVQNKQGEIDDFLSENISNLAQPLFLSSLDDLMALGYRPSLKNQELLISQADLIFKEQDSNNYDAAANIYQNFATVDKLESEIEKLLERNTDLDKSASGLLISRTLYSYSSYGDTKPEMPKDLQSLLNKLIENNELDYGGFEGGKLSVLDGFTKYLTEENAIKLFEESSSDINEVSRYGLWLQLKKEKFDPPDFIFDKESFKKDLQTYPSFAMELFSPESKEFVKENITFPDLVQDFKNIATENNIFDLNWDPDVFDAFDYDYFKTIDGYTPELERELSDFILSQLNSQKNPEGDLDNYYFIPYLLSQNPNLDVGKYIVTWLSNSESWTINSVTKDEKAKEIFVKLISKVSTKDMAQLIATNPDRYYDIMDLIDEFNFQQTQIKR